MEFKWKARKKVEKEENDGTNILYTYTFEECGNLGGKKLILIRDKEIPSFLPETTVKIEINANQTKVN